MVQKRLQNKTVLFLVEDVGHKYLYEYLYNQYKREDNYEIHFQKKGKNAEALLRQARKGTTMHGFEKCFVVADDDRQDTPKNTRSKNIDFIPIRPCIEALFMVIIKQETKHSQEAKCDKAKSLFKEHRNRQEDKIKKEDIERYVDKDGKICKALELDRLSQDPNIKALKKIIKILQGNLS